MFDMSEIDCHSSPFMIFSIIDIVQILLTMVAVWFIFQRLQKQYKKRLAKSPKVINSQLHESIICSNSNGNEMEFNKDDIHLSLTVGGISENIKTCEDFIIMNDTQMLQKSHQLLILFGVILFEAIITGIYEVWNYLRITECDQFFGVCLDGFLFYCFNCFLFFCRI